MEKAKKNKYLKMLQNKLQKSKFLKKIVHNRHAKSTFAVSNSNNDKKYARLLE